MSMIAAIHSSRQESAEGSELQRLRDRVEELEELLGLNDRDEPNRFGFLRLSPSERTVFHALVKWKIVTVEKLHVLMFSMRPEYRQPEGNVAHVYVSKVRKKLRPWGVTINNEFGRGWFLKQADKHRLNELASKWERGEPIP